MRILNRQRLDKKIFQVVEMNSEVNIDSWKTKTPVERLEGLEILRQMWSPYDPDTERLQRIYSIAEQT